MPRKLFCLLGLLCTLLISTSAGAQGQVRILAYGDSNTWGWKPVADGKPVPRYDDSQRWPGAMQRALGPRFVVGVNGLIGRTLEADLAEGVGQLDGQDHNGMRRLALALSEAAPIHLLVVMLGTNDLIDDLNRTPQEIAASLAKLVDVAKAGTAAYSTSQRQHVLIVVPPPLGDTGRTPFKAVFGPRSIEKSKQLATAFERAGRDLGVPVFNAGSVVALDGVDGVHLSMQAHRRLGEALAKEVRRWVSP